MKKLQNFRHASMTERLSWRKQRLLAKLLSHRSMTKIFLIPIIDFTTKERAKQLFESRASGSAPPATFRLHLQPLLLPNPALPLPTAITAAPFFSLNDHQLLRSFCNKTFSGRTSSTFPLLDLGLLRKKARHHPKEARNQAAYREPISKGCIERNLTFRRDINGG